MIESKSSVRGLLPSFFALLAALAALIAPAPAPAATTGCLVDMSTGEPLRRTFFTHDFVDYLTDRFGCFSIPVDPPAGRNSLRIEVHRQNPVVRMDDGFTGAMVSRRLDVVDGETTFVLLGQDPNPAMTVAESMRRAYENGLREFSPWRTEFPNNTWRPLPWIRVLIPSLFVVALPWTEPFSTTTGFPTVHIRAGDANDHRLHAHELGHALHFSKLSAETRSEIEVRYAAFLTGPNPVHFLDAQTNPMVAYLEAFGCFVELYESTAGRAGAASGPVRHEFFHRMIDRSIEDGDLVCGGTMTSRLAGADVEGAVMLTLFHRFARHPAVGLDFVIDQMVECDAIDVIEYADCIRRDFGRGSAEYVALVGAAARHGIDLPDADAPLHGMIESGDRFGEAVAIGDFDGDGTDDLAVGAPDEAIGSIRGAGAVTVIYGSQIGPIREGNQMFHGNTPGMPGPDLDGDSFGESRIAARAATNARFGEALAAGDFDGDGYDDLAIGAPGENVSRAVRAGYVVVLYGSPEGLGTDRADSWQQDHPGVADHAEDDDRFGSVLAVGDFDGDAHDDLAVGVPLEDVDAWVYRVYQHYDDAGVVHVLYGSSRGLYTVGSQLWHQASGGVLGNPDVGDRFGESLATGHFGSGLYDSLAIGVPREDVNGRTDAGAVAVLYGSSSRLSASGNQLWHQDVAGIWGAAQDYDRFGSVLAAGNFNDDTRDDLVIGVPHEDIGSIVNAGAVQVIYGAGTALNASGNTGFHQNTPGVWGGSETGDMLGAALAVGDFDGQPGDDLAIGAPREDIGSTVDTGSVQLLFGRPTSGLVVTGDLGWYQGLASIGETAEAGDRFGAALASGDLDGDGRDDLAVGVPQESYGTRVYGGGVHVVISANVGASLTRNSFWHQNR